MALTLRYAIEPREPGGECYHIAGPRGLSKLSLYSEGELKGVERRGMMGSAVWATMI